MTGQEPERSSGHVFISYVREDSARVDRLERELGAAGLRVWRDVNDIGPGSDWQIEIKKAIGAGAIGFVACFSSNSENRDSTYQREELILAAEQLRCRPLGRAWLFPVRFDDCDIPDYDIGAGRTFKRLHRTDLFDDDWSQIGRLATGLVALVRPEGSTAAGDEPQPVPETGWASLPSLPEQVRSLLRAQVEVAHELPYRLPGARRPSLDVVYVRQDLSSGAEDESPPQRPTMIVDDDGNVVEAGVEAVERASVRPPARTVSEALDGDQHLVVTGGPGQGKSTLSLRLAADLAASWTASGEPTGLTAEPVLPLRLTARELARRLDLPFGRAVADTVRIEYGALLRVEVEAQVVADRVGGCRWLLLVDGLDEVTDVVERDRLVAVLAARVADEPSPYRIVLTTRPLDGSTLAPLHRIGAMRYMLLPFDEEALRAFANNWFGSTGSEVYRFLRQIRNARLDELVRVPLLATIAAIIFEQLQAGGRLPDNQYELYESYLVHLRTAHAGSPSRFDNARDGLLEHLGRVRLEADTSILAAAKSWVTDNVDGSRDMDRDAELVTFLTSVGPLVRRGDDLQFLHFSFAEHLAATAAARLLPAAFEPATPAFAQLLHAARAENAGRQARSVVVHYTRQRPAETDPIVGWLHSGDGEQHVVAARLLAQHVPASDGVVTAFLDTARAWAMTTQYQGQQVVRHSSRIVHHPGAADWLGAIVEDPHAPWQSRVEAASALAGRIHGPHTKNAIAWLRTSMDDPASPVALRLAAAEALVEVGGADRDAAERGLRSVLTDRAAPASDLRDAATVLAGLGRAAHACAVEVLADLISDTTAPDFDRAESAAGLAEIDVGRSADCAVVLLEMLGVSRDAYPTLRAAAKGLIAAGPDHIHPAIELLMRKLQDRRLTVLGRVSAARVLAEVAPKARQQVGRQLVAIAKDPLTPTFWRWYIGQSMEQFGEEFADIAVELLRFATRDWTQSPGSRLSAATQLAELGPAHREEAAAVLERLAGLTSTPPTDRIHALGQLATMGDAHRATAVEALSAYMASDGEPAARYEAATRLVRIGPEFHPNVVRQLQRITAVRAAPVVRVRAWSLLMTLRADMRELCGEMIVALVTRERYADLRSGESAMRYLSAADLPDVPRFAAWLAERLDDASLDTEQRSEAARALVLLGRPWHPIAADGAVALVRSGAVPWQAFRSWIDLGRDLGVRLRESLACAVMEFAVQSHMPSSALVEAAAGIDRLQCEPPAALVAHLERVVAGRSTPVDDKAEGVVLLARLEPCRVAEAVADVLGLFDGIEWGYRWAQCVRDVAVLGGDVAPHLRELLPRSDPSRQQSHAVAEILARLSGAYRQDGLDELKRQSADEYLRFYWRTEAVKDLAELDPATIAAAIRYHRQVLDDETEPIEARAEAAATLARLDHAAADGYGAALRLFATSRHLTLAENATALEWSSRQESAEVERLALAVVHHPAAPPSVRRSLLYRVRGLQTGDAVLSMLTDPTLPIRERIPRRTPDGYAPHAAATLTVVREAMSAIESSRADRLAAAEALADLDPTYADEAAATLRELAALPGGHQALEALAKLDPSRYEGVVDNAVRVVQDTRQSAAARFKAASLVARLDPDPPDSVTAYLRAAADGPASNERALVAAHLLRRPDGMTRVRVCRDGRRSTPAIRWRAAVMLRDWTVDDRAAGADVLQAIASDPEQRASLRCAAGRALMMFGAAGRRLGTAALQHLADEPGVPVTSQAAAAATVARERPDLRDDMLQVLHRLRTSTAEPHRLLVLREIGEFEPEVAASALAGALQSDGLLPVARVRYAIALAELHRDHRETATAAVRGVAEDATVARHVRVRAARLLCRWSPLCRRDGRGLLARLLEGWQTTQLG